MLIYVDESWIPNPASPTSHFTLAGVAIKEDVHREFNARLHKLKQRFSRQDSSDWEIKGRDLLKPNFDAYPRNTEFTKELISLCRQSDIVIFAVIQQYASGQLKEDLAPDKPMPGSLEGAVLLGNLYKFLIERAQAYIAEQHPEQHAILVFDQKDARKDEQRARAFSQFLHRSSWGRQMNQVLETAFFVNSKITPGIQVADLVAYTMNQYFEGRQSDLQYYYKEFAALQFLSRDATAEIPLKGIRTSKQSRRTKSNKKGKRRPKSQLCL